MNPILKNVLAFVVGWLGGSAVNMGLVQAGHTIFPIDGVDPNDMEALSAIMPTLGFEYFIFPFLAHALGTLVGAIVAGTIATTQQMKISLGIGGFFLLGGIAVNFILPGPIWFAVVDIQFAYIPMAWLGGRITLGKTS
ncbi:MAG: hypothetical protein AAGC88_07835 [Bacteroidota bacterium]